jgi:hypothetical protein
MGNRNRQSKTRKLKPAIVKDVNPQEVAYEEVILLYRTDGDRTPNKRILILCEGETEIEYFEQLKLNTALAHRLAAVLIEPIIYKPSDNSLTGLVWEAMQRKRTEARKGNPFNSIWIVFDNDERNSFKLDESTLLRLQGKLSTPIYNLIATHENEFFLSEYDYIQALNTWTIPTAQHQIIIENTTKHQHFEDYFDANPRQLFLNSDGTFDTQNGKTERNFDANWQQYIKFAYTCMSFENWILLHFEQNKTTFRKPDNVIDYLQTHHAPNYEKGYALSHKPISAYTCLHQLISQDKDQIALEKIETAIENTAWLKNEMQPSVNRQNDKVYEVNPYVMVDNLLIELLDKNTKYHTLNFGQVFDNQSLSLITTQNTDQTVSLTIENKTNDNLLINNGNFQTFFHCIVINNHRRIRHEITAINQRFLLRNTQSDTITLTLPNIENSHRLIIKLLKYTFIIQ